MRPARTKGRAARWLRQILASGTVVALAGVPSTVLNLNGEQARPTESQVQVAYLYNFGKFVQWPADAPVAKSGYFNICIYGLDPFGPILNTTVVGEKIDGKGVLAKRVADLHEAASCQILFISSSENSRLSKILEGLSGAAVLTVSDMPQFLERGGMIHFILDKKRVRFEVDLTATQNAGLNLSSELLKVAAAVKGSPSPGG